MMNILPDMQPKTFDLFEHGNVGLFEISDAGTVLYCRTAGEKLSYEKSALAIGRNFFDDVAPFENTEELRRHFNHFIKSDNPSENFNFTCLVESREIPAKIMLVRITERSDDERAKTTIVDIRKI